MNEPYGMLRTTPWETIAQACINAIREVDTETMLVISGNEYSSASRWKEVSDGLKNLVDPCDNMISKLTFISIGMLREIIPDRTMKTVRLFKPVWLVCGLLSNG